MLLENSGNENEGNGSKDGKLGKIFLRSIYMKKEILEKVGQVR